MATILECLQSAARGEAVLVVGSGVGYLAKNAKTETIPSATKLLELMFADLGEPNDSRAPLDRVASHYGEKIGFPALLELLRENLTVAEINDDYKKLLCAPWRRIYTTNFDNAIEFAAPTKRSHVLPEDLRNIERGNIVHLNGHIRDTLPTTFDFQMQLTTWSYASSQFPNSELANFFRADLRAARHILFLGISLNSDLDITRIVADNRIPRDKIVFVVGPETKPYDITTLEKYGKVNTAGAHAVISTYLTLQDTEITAGTRLPVSSFFSFARQETSTPSSRLTLRDQLLFGHIDLRHLITSEERSLAGSNQRLIGRHQAKSLAATILSGTTDTAILHGDIGSGKTFIAIEVARQLYDAGYDVFWARADRFDPEEVQLVAQRDNPTLVVFDGYIENRDAIECLKRLRNRNTPILLCLRSVVYDLSRETIAALLGDGIFVMPIRPLSEDELKSLDSILLASGLLGSAASGDVGSRVSKYRVQLGSSLFRILVDLIQSDYVREQIEREITPILNDPNVKTAFSTILVGSVLETGFDLDQWDECVGALAVDRLLGSYEKIVKQFLDSNGYSFISRPTIMGSELLRETFPSSLTASGLLVLYRYALKTSFAIGSRRLTETVMRYSRIERLFKDEQKYESLLRYYDDMQDFSQTDGNSQYWLQKAIATSIHGDLTQPQILARTNNYFLTAYARAERGSDRQRKNIDNYYARFMLMHALNQDDAEKAFTLTNDSIVRLIRQIHLDEAKQYPFKAGRTLADIVIKFSSRWPADRRSRMLTSIDRLLTYAREYLTAHGYSREVSTMIDDCNGVRSLLGGR